MLQKFCWHCHLRQLPNATARTEPEVPGEVPRPSATQLVSAPESMRWGGCAMETCNEQRDLERWHSTRSVKGEPALTPAQCLPWTAFPGANAIEWDMDSARGLLPSATFIGGGMEYHH